LQRPLEAGDRLRVVEAVEPVEAPIEPELGLGHCGGDLARVRAQIVVVHVLLHDGGRWRDANGLRQCRPIMSQVRWYVNGLREGASPAEAVSVQSSRTQ